MVGVRDRRRRVRGIVLRAVAIVAIVVISWIFFKESLCWVQIAGIVLVIAGVGLLELGGKHA